MTSQVVLFSFFQCFECNRFKLHPMPSGTGQFWRDWLLRNRSSLPWRALLSGALVLAIAEALSSLIRARLLPPTPFFDIPALWLGFAVCKGLIFGPILGVITVSAYRYWRKGHWDDACYLCLRGGFGLCVTQGIFALLSFLSRSYFPLLAWQETSWSHFALWLTLNVALMWALLLLVAGFLLPSDVHKTIQISDEVRL
jgi:hypothetical protein